uniref:Leucine-rich repeat protein isoform S1 n=1 Tax=Cupiennius salei TaxID=6928 RepID=A0A4Y5UGI2_CUPSA|nr:leucine-rich repeat protein isoform S1 [Cupiennius salei]QDC23081.1 leucine-rich repeat protein isoform S1 [Cupiennius salei]
MWYWVIWKILLGLACLVASNVPECPPRENVYPCDCASDYYSTWIECRSIHGVEKMELALENTRGLNVSYAFWKSRLGDIPSDFFKGQKSTSVHFENCQIGSFGDRPFTGLEDTLKSIYIYGSVDKRRKDLETFRLGHLKKVTELIFEANDIKRLGNDWFEGGPAPLKLLMLEANDIEELGDRAFASLENLEQIMLGDNRFGKISRSMFPRPATKLKYLETSFNGIRELPEDLFEDMPVLNSINVSGNKLKSVPEATWGKIWGQLDEVYLERNEGFECDENIKWIYQRRLPRILTGQCRGGKFAGKKLQDLTLADFD